MTKQLTNSFKFKRIFLIVTDSLGIGADARAAEFKSVGANTLLSASKTGLLEIPTWKKLGIDSIAKLEGFNKAKNQTAYMMRLSELSNAKDTLAGHWEMMGVLTEVPFVNFKETGFPPAMLAALEKAWGRKIVGNRAASGTDIINELADEEILHNKIIIYTSADSVLQICGHEKYMGLAQLYQYCEQARQICDANPAWKVGRVIARPYLGEAKGQYERTPNRHDYAVLPFHKTLVETLLAADINTVAIGKISDIFGGRGFKTKVQGKSDDENMDLTIDNALSLNKPSLVFTNLGDFDSEYGHRRDAEGYARNLNRFDIKLAKLINAMREDDLLLITSDHGTDPGFAGSDHTREEVPLTIFAKNFTATPRALPPALGFGTVGNIIARNFNLPLVKTGEDVFDLIK